MHERGMADDELIEDHERDRFENVRGDVTDGDGSTTNDRARAMADRDGDGSTMDDRARAAMGRDDDRDGVDDRREGAAAAGDTSDYQQGRIDERRDEDSRFGRSTPAADEQQDRVR
jgi:hypothetical protein